MAFDVLKKATTDTFTPKERKEMVQAFEEKFGSENVSENGGSQFAKIPKGQHTIVPVNENFTVHLYPFKDDDGNDKVFITYSGKFQVINDDGEYFTKSGALSATPQTVVLPVSSEVVDLYEDSINTRIKAEFSTETKEKNGRKRTYLNVEPILGETPTEDIEPDAKPKKKSKWNK